MNQYSPVEPIARSLHLNVQPVRLDQAPYNFDAAFQAMRQQRAEMLLVLSSSLFGLQRSRITDLALRHRLPTMFSQRPTRTRGIVLVRSGYHRDVQARRRL